MSMIYLDPLGIGGIWIDDTLPEDSDNANYQTGKNNHFYGQKHTSESKKIMRKNNARAFKGRKHSEETKKKMSEARKKQGNFRKGYTHSEETKKKISKSLKTI